MDFVKPTNTNGKRIFQMKKPFRSKKKFTEKTSHSKRFIVYRRSGRKISEIKRLLKNFLSRRCSAAGVPYIVRSRSLWKKLLWFATVVIISLFMGYMTFNVIMEYMEYPKMLIREEILPLEMQFPAVTICSLNPLVNITSNETSFYKLMELKRLLDKTETEHSNSDLRDECYVHPLCQWSWFDESCHCVKYPCSTEFCLVKNKTHCGCSSDLCEDFTSCTIPADLDRCVCSKSVQYPSDLETLKRLIDYQDPYWLNISTPVQELINLIQNASVNDLKDIKEALLPSVNDLLEYGIKFDNFVISCSFDGKRCGRENFTVLYHPHFGRCYMFNYLGFKHNTEKSVISYSYGSSSGLRLILQVRKRDTIELLNAETGARIVVHDPYTLPFVAEYGINVRPHDMSAIEVKQSILNRLKPPYGNCVQDGSHLDFDLTPEQPYSILGCQKACRHFHLMKFCNCTRRTYITGSVFYMTTTTMKFCNRKAKKAYKCMIRTLIEIDQGKIPCDCRPPCTEVSYSRKVSACDLNEHYYKAVKSIRTSFTENGTHKIVNATDPSNLMVGVKVYYSTFQVNREREEASYSWETLIANIGGNLSFFMGLTIITFIEVLEFLMDIGVTSFSKYMKFQSRSKKKFQVHPKTIAW